MITIENNQQYVYTLAHKIDKNANMVIVGNGNTDNFHKQLLYFDNIEDVEYVFGNSQLTDAFITAKSFGCKHIFLVNTVMKYDYIDITNILMQYDFAYIVPINININDYFINPHTDNKEYYVEYMSKQMNESNNSCIVTTDKHATLFDDIDNFISYTNNNSNIIFNRLNNQSVDTTNLVYVANNLYNYEFANVVLAASLCSSKLNEYPNNNFGKSIFDIDELDTRDMDFVFFQNNLNNTTIEHLFNLNRDNPLQKDLMINRIVTYIKRNLTFDEYIGTSYNGQQLITIKNKINNFLDKLVDAVLKEYYIKNIFLTKERVFVGNIVIELEIIPIGHAESISVVIQN